MIITDRTYVAIDLKSFYASVECVERGLDPLTTKLVVADESRTDKTICLAVTPELKKYGLSGRSRLFEVRQKAKEIKNRTGLDLDYIVAPPRMGLYMEYSDRIYGIYLKYFSSEDIHIYSVDEVFIDVTNYLALYKKSAEELTREVIRTILSDTGITATAGIATNLYLCKIAMDIVAKHIDGDEFGVRIASLDEYSYRQKLWSHRPLTDFWRVGPGISRRLEKAGIYTMGDLARASLDGADYLYKIFGIDAEILIDHAWGYEPCTIADIKKFKPRTKSLSQGQVLQCPYDFNKARIIVREMTEIMVLDMVDKGLMAGGVTLVIGYDRANVDNGRYTGEVHIDHYGTAVPKPAHGSINLGMGSSSTKKIMDGVMKLYDEIVDPNLLIRRINITANNTVNESYEQFDLFTDPKDLEREKRMQRAMLSIQKRYGKNAILKGTNLEEGATTIERNSYIGGHKA